MLISTREHDTIGNTTTGSRRGRGELNQVRKKARCQGSGTMSTERNTGNHVRPSLHVDVTFSRLASPRRQSSVVRRSPIVFDDNVGDANVHGTSDRLESEESFVLSRRLLRRRHVRKEQLRTQREAQEVRNNMRETRGHRKRKAASGRGVARGSVVTDATTDTHCLPQLSPMILKSDSFSSMSRVSTTNGRQSAGNDVWTIEVGESPESFTNASTTTESGGVLAEDDAPPVRFIAFPLKKATHPTTKNIRISFSPLRSRGSM